MTPIVAKWSNRSLRGSRGNMGDVGIIVLDQVFQPILPLAKRPNAMDSNNYRVGRGRLHDRRFGLIRYVGLGNPAHIGGLKLKRRVSSRNGRGYFSLASARNGSAGLMECAKIGSSNSAKTKRLSRLVVSFCCSRKIEADTAVGAH